MIRSVNSNRRGAGTRRHALVGSVALVGAMLALAPALGAASSRAIHSAAPRAPQAAAAAQTFNVSVDAHTPENQTAFLAYFPKAVSAHPGDTIQFDLADSGEPHSVTFGTLVDSGFAALASWTDPNTEPPDLAKLPLMLPAGPGDANQVAANPCYLASGDPPADATKACPTTDQPAFDGTQSFYNSGWLGPDQPFTVALSPNIKPGTYTYFCLLHRAGMTGSITVVDASTDVKSPGDVTAEGEAEIAATVAKLAPAVQQASAAPPALAGVFAQDVQDALSTTFQPGAISIPVGGSVTWTILGPHTVSFNAPQSAVTLRAEAPDGTIHINPQGLMPAGGPGAPPPASGPPDPSSPPIMIDAGTWNGTGFLSSGVLVSFPPGPFYQYKVTFSTAGTYKYQCLVHVDMQGTIKVGS